MKKAIKASAACPCCSGLAYAACCQPVHRGEREAADAVALMRSRYAAFALGHVEHLVRTLHPDHPDAAMPRETLVATLEAACRTYKYTGLTVLEQGEEGDRARVVFRARVFEKGKDLSFTEASTFVRDGGGWRYLAGETVPS